MKHVLQIAGYQNSGKTTLMEKLIAHATEQGKRVAVIKHHGHGGVPELPDGKDSTRHHQAGAFVTGVEGGGILQLTIQQPSWTLPELLKLYDQFPVDSILIEGFKQTDYPKVVIIRSEEDIALVSLPGVQCVIAWCDMPKQKVPVFHVKQDDEYVPFLFKLLSANVLKI